MNYQKLNNITGWLIFAVALGVYLSTMAPTASFWDCGEFIACSYELEVTHPPGAPLFLLLGRIFSLFAPGPESVAFMVNLLSVLSGAFTAMLTCWITTMLASRAMQGYLHNKSSKETAILFAGAVAGLACTFADSIWFNSVEAEVYSMSSFFTAVVVWLMLKWEARADNPNHLKWILLIAYVMGLSIGVHLLNLLTIPALALIYFFRKYDFSWKGLFATLGISVVILALVQYGIIQYLFDLAWQFEKIFTGTMEASGATIGGMGLPKGTGATILGLLLVSLLVGLLVVSQKRKLVILNTAVLAFSLILMGFSSYAVIFIRSQANPAIDMNNPENLLTFLSYMKREQYGDRPLLRGTLYNARPETEIKGNQRVTKMETQGMRYIEVDGAERYVEDGEEREYVYADRDIVWFPRMYTPSRYSSGRHGYINYVSNLGADKKSPYDDRPTRGEDLTFFFSYQLNHMYFRYFMWNFVGRASDLKEADWQSGFETAAQREPYQNNKAHNHYYFLPLFIGLLGLVWQASVNKNQALIVGALFLFTGIAIIVYLNQYPSQPRERDYSYAGSFQTFCIWIGLGVIFLYEVWRKYLKAAAPYVAGILCLGVTALMAVENWDDHSRKGRWIDVEFAYNLLNSCAPNGILFTGGDNDTFPLWYAQEVEGYRTDVRVVNLELLISDWYIEQMTSTRNGTPGIPLTMQPKDYSGLKGQVVYGNYDKDILLPSNKNQLLRDGIISPEEAAQTDSLMVWDFKPRSQRYIYRKDLVIIELLQNIATNGWKRPVYFANTMAPSSYLNLDPYLHMEGMAYRVLPVKKVETPQNRYFTGSVRIDSTKKRLLDIYQFTGLDDPTVNLDQHIRDIILSNYRNVFFRLSNAYANQITQLDTRIRQVAGVMQQETDTERLTALQEEIRNMQQTGAQLKDSLRKVVVYGKQSITHEVAEPPFAQQLRKAQLLFQVGVNDLARKEFEWLVPRAVATLERYKAAGRQIDQQDFHFNGLLLSIQFYANQRELETARGLADQVKVLTGSEIGEQILQQSLGQPAN
ncbi:MAG: DUF2723 domain-containing protein [Bacteroidota bacterium]